MKKSQVVFISNPAIGNLVPTVEFASALTNRDRRFSATILIISLPERPLVNSYIESQTATSSHTNIKFVYLPTVDPPSPDSYNSSLGYLCLFIEKHKPLVKQAITGLMSPESATYSDSARVDGLFVDMFCTSMIDVANELGVPSYLFFASPASFLGFMIELPSLHTKIETEFVHSDTEFIVPKDPRTELIVSSFANPLTPLVLPSIVLKKKDGYFWFLHHARRYMEVKGIIVNTFKELEPFALDSIHNYEEAPPIYSVGPILDLNGPAQWHPNRAQQESILQWLDKQPPQSVVFLCFGSMGSLSGAQLKEIAFGLERAGFRFLWSVREPPKGKLDLPGEYANLGKTLPEGFLDRTAEMGLVCGWVSQVTILGHQAIGGFVSHCGWNSILESLWYGVPIATWPLYAEQQMNAFQLVKELGLAMAIRLDYREGSDLVHAEELKRAIERLMNGDDEVRKRVEEIKEKSRTAVMENGSSYKSLGLLIEKLTA